MEISVRKARDCPPSRCGDPAFVRTVVIVRNEAHEATKGDEVMNSMNELLNPDLIDQKIADLRTDAVAWRRAHEATAVARPERTWSLSAVLRVPVFRQGGQATKAI